MGTGGLWSGGMPLDRKRPACGRQRAGEAEFGDLAGEVPGLLLRGPAVEVVWAEVVPEGAVAEHVPGGGEDGRGDGADRLLGAAALAQSGELGAQVAVLLAAGGPGALDEGGLEPGRALAQAGGGGGAGALVGAGGEAGARGGGGGRGVGWEKG